MTHLVNLLADPNVLAVRLRVGATEPEEMRRAVAKLAHNGPTPVQESEAIGALQQRIAGWATACGAQRLSRRDLRTGCQAALHPPHPLTADETVIGRVFHEVEHNKRRAAFFALIDAYLDGFDQDDQSLMAFAKRLEALSARWPWRDNDSWSERIATFYLLDPVRAPGLLARRVLDDDEDLDTVLRSAGLDTVGRRFGGLAETAFRAACRLVRQMKGEDAVQGQRTLIDWARNDSGDFGFPRVWPEFVEASLAPWEIEEPSEAHKSALLAVLERFGGGDPRAVPGRWRTVMDQAPGAYAVLMRWLTRASVLQFLDIVDRLMPDYASKLMWSYRRAFWMSYLLSDGSSPGIDAAWVAFGDDGARLARKVARETGDKSFTAFGKQADKSGQHAALILKMGDLTIVDWSHKAKYQVWRFGDKGAPKLFEPVYRYGELYSAPIQESHSSPRTFTWQKSLARIIEGRNFFDPKASWRPRGV